MAPARGARPLQGHDHGAHPAHGPRARSSRSGEPCPGARTIVVTRDPQWHHPGVETAHSFEEALALAGPADEVFVAGGAQVYEQSLPFAHRMVLTEVDATPEGDTWFPAWARADWSEEGREAHEGWSHVVYERVPA